MISTVSGTLLSAQLRDPKLRPSAIAKIVAAVRQARGSTTVAAHTLGVSYQTLGAWRAKIRQLESQIVATQRELGWRPPGASLFSRRKQAAKKKLV